MKMLVVSCSPWREDNSIGNSYSNIFNGIKNLEIAHICCGTGTPQTDLVDKHFHISERDIIKSLFNRSYEVGKVFEKKDLNCENSKNSNNKIYDFMRIYRLQIFFILRNLIWGIPTWKSQKLKDFVDEFNPDFIFCPFLDSSYMNEMVLFLHQYKNIPVVTYAWDDVYTLKQFSVSPLFWINKLYQRKKLKQIANISSLFYTISEMQQEEYSRIFSKECKLLYKGYDFKGDFTKEDSVNNPIQFLYTGNISEGRWKTLSEIGVALSKINKNTLKAQLVIYTNTPMNKKMRKKLNIPGSVLIKDPVSYNKILELQKKADVLVHVESFNKKESLKVRLSFSTKLVDYFYNKKCILAIGNKNVASIKYLMKNSAAIMGVNEDEIHNQLNYIVNNPKVISEYSKKSWNCGMLNHQIYKIQEDLYESLIKII